MIIFHQFLLPDLYYYPTSSNLIRNHTRTSSGRDPPPSPLGWARRWSEPKKREGDGELE